MADRGRSVLFMPDAVLPEQYAALHRASGVTPERALMLAVVETAVAEMLSGKGWVQADARDWFASDDTTWPYSFAAICEAFGWDAQAARAALKRLERKAQG